MQVYAQECIQAVKDRARPCLEAVGRFPFQELTEKVVRGGICVYAIHMLVKGHNSSESLQWAGATAILLTIKTLVNHIFPDKYCSKDIQAYADPDFYMNIAKHAVVLVAGCLVSRSVFNNPIFIKMMYSAVMVQAIFEFTRASADIFFISKKA